ncbi:hypothetical protein QA596_07735 [Balneolales bacterium ANBcel1]|nr:hypothetical protein [Balneolales bacterium ANBcel1]
MKIGIIGPEHMALTWEAHLRSISEVHQAIIAPKISLLNDVDACLILSDERSASTGPGDLVEAVKRGYHTLSIGPLPTDPELVESWNEASEESGAILMFSMWAHYSPAWQWLFNHIPIPRKIHVHREWAGPKHTPDVFTLYRILLEELSLCLKWVGGNPVSIEGDLNIAPHHRDEPHNIRQLHVKFGNGTTASIILTPFGLENRHSRFAIGDKMAAVCQINEHLVKKWFLHGEHAHTPELMRFNSMEPAGMLLSHFMRAIRSGTRPAFGIAELHQLTSLIHRYPKA